MRLIALDTETTGLDPNLGHRIIELACVEIIDRRLTGKTFHAYLNPQRTVEKGAYAVHGIDEMFLKDKPLFTEISESFLEFVKGAELIIHNAPFDIGFLEHEFSLTGKSYKNMDEYCKVTDTLQLARKLHPGQKNNLDALSKRYNVDVSHREKHGALIDAEILAQVYLTMTGGQVSLFGSTSEENILDTEINIDKKQLGSFVVPIQTATEEELQQHQHYLEELKKAAGKVVWEEGE